MIEDLFIEILAKVENEEAIIDSKALYHEVLNFIKQLATSCKSAAMCIFSLVSSVCYFNPELERLMIRNAVRPLFYLGISEASNIVKWVEWFCNDEKTNNNTLSKIHPSSKGMCWLEKVFPQRLDFINIALDELKAVCEIYDILSGLKFDSVNKKVTLDIAVGDLAFKEEFLNYKELNLYLVDLLQKLLPSTNRSELEILVDEELVDEEKKLKSVGWL